MSDYSEFDSSDEHIPLEIDDDYLDEIHPEMDTEYLEIYPDPDDLDAYQEMNID